jgi:hypothetical protein|tara:strand:+ start:3553 stop:4089 length:537 start_codon:yes stop_codon:yes gene_type:complete
MSSIIKVNTVEERDAGNGVTIDGLKIKDVTSGSVMSKPVLQVVTGTTNTDTGSIASTSFTDTGLTASITPSSTSSKILVVVQQNSSVYRDSSLEIYGYINIMRDSTEIGEWFAQGRPAPVLIGPVNIMYLDSPNSTSALAYKTQIKASTTDNGGLVRANQFSTSGESPSSIHLIEIAG